MRVYADGRHGWTDKLIYSDRPRTPGDEVPPDVLASGLRGFLDDQERPGELTSGSAGAVGEYAQRAGGYPQVQTSMVMRHDLP